VKTLPTVLNLQSTTFYAETGSGKTLCYLLPIVQNLMKTPSTANQATATLQNPSPELIKNNSSRNGKEMTKSLEEAKSEIQFQNQADDNLKLKTETDGTEDSNQSKREFSERPLMKLRALILEPSLELAFQVHHNLGKLIKGTNLTTHLIGSGFGLEVKNNIDILVSTPGSLKHFDLHKILLNLEHLVLDEVDALLDGGSKKIIYDILATGNRIQLDRIEKSKNLAVKQPQEKEKVTEIQYLFSAATLPSKAWKSPMRFIDEHFPGIHKISSSGVHRSVASLKERFIELPLGQKLPQLIEDLNMRPPVRTLVFVRTLKQAQNLRDLLAAHKIQVDVLSRTDDVNDRVKLMEKYLTGDFQTLICTDLASRGLDFPDVQRVIQFDFALSAIDYLHRVGRTARANKAGEVINYVTIEDRDLAEAIQRESTIDNISGLFSRNRSFRKKLRKNLRLKV